jgi:hypothetical protein
MGLLKKIRERLVIKFKVLFAIYKVAKSSLIS